MVRLIRTNFENKNFVELVRQLDADLAIRDGDEHAFYDQFNKIDKIKYVVVAYEEGKAISCGAIKHYDDNAVEVKRMFTLPESRGKGLASIILAELESWAVELSYKKCILETGVKQHEAIGLYKKNSYIQVPNYGQYANAPNSRCFEKVLIKKPTN